MCTFQKDRAGFLTRELQQANARVAELEAEVLRLRELTAARDTHDGEGALGRIGDAYMALDSGLRFVWVNAEAERLLRTPREQLAGRALPDVLQDHAGRVLAQTCASVLRNSRPEEVETCYSPVNRWYLNKVYPTREGGLAVACRDISDQKRILADQRRQARVLEQVHDSIISTDLAGIVTRWNHGAEALFGYSADEIVGQHVSLLYFEEDRPTVYARVLEPLLREGKLDIELRNRHKSGQECYIRLSLSLLRDDSDEAYGMLGVAVDTTAQRKAERALRDSEELYRCLVDTVPQIVWLAGSDGRTQMIGSRWEEYSGGKADECLALNWLNWIHPDDIPGVTEHWMRCVETGDTFEKIYRVRNAAGEYRWHLSKSVPVRGRDGTVGKWVGVLTDLHDHKVAEDKLRLSEERMRLAQDAASFGHFELNFRTGEFIISPALRRLLNVPPDENITFEGKLSHLHPEDQPLVQDAIERVKQGEASKISIRYRTTPPRGGLCWRILEASAYQDADGNPSRLVGVIADITPHQIAAEAIRAEHELKRLESIFQSLTEAVVIVSADGRLLSMNPAALRLHEAEPEDPLPSTLDEVAQLFDMQHLDGRPFAVEEWPASRALRGEVFTGFELLATNRRTGSRWAASYGGAPVHDEHGDVVMAVISIRNVTAERSASEEIRLANRALHELSGRLLRLQDEERRRISLELHDGTVQLLSAAIMNLSLLEESPVFHEKPQERRLLDKTLALTQQCTRELRTMSYLLHPPALDELGFVPALLSWVDGFSERSGIPVDMMLPQETTRFSPELETALFRITQEALGNVHRHSRCQNARIRLKVLEGSVSLEIGDDGIGFNTRDRSGTRKGVGLLGMRERSIQLGGVFSVESEPGNTVVRAELPLRPPHA